MVIEPSDPTADRRALAKLGTWLQRFGPVVGIQQEEFPQSLLIEATHLAPLYSGEGELLHQLRLGIERLGLRAHIALADSIGAAWGVAHHPRTKGERNCTTDCIPLGGQREAIAPLPLSALRLEPALSNTLHQLGFGRVEEVLALPRDELDTRFGPQLRLRIEQALGNSHEAIDPIPPSGEFVAQWQLEHPTTRLAAVEKIVRLLVRQVAYQLESQGQGTLEMACRFVCPPAESVVLRAGLFRPTSDANHLQEIVDLQLERLLLPAPVTEVQLSVGKSVRNSARQQMLFEPDESLESSWQLAGLVDRLSGKLGAERVVRCSLENQALPELTWHEDPLVGPSPVQPKKGGNATLTSIPREVTDRPLHLLERPLPLQVMAVAPDGPPVRFHTKQDEHQVARHWGPERIVTGWGRRQGVPRDYYRVETIEGRRFWLFRHQRSGRWFLHGLF